MKNSIKSNHELCENSVLEFPRYFPRQLITPVEMTLEQKYFRDKLRRHNRLMHGWGVVCGALVCPKPKTNGNGFEPWKVMVKPGYILGPYGDEIIIDCDRTFDLRTMCLTGITGEPCSDESVDPWCSEVFVKRENGTLYVAVKYKEVMTRPVRVQPVGCGCDETQCEYSRWCDGYEICVLTECPESKENPPSLEDLTKKLPECPCCPSDPWVVLAKVDVNGDGMIQKIDNCSCRRLVISFGHFWWGCKIGDACKIKEVTPNVLTPGTTDITVTGEHFQDGATVDFGSSDVIVSGKVDVEGTKLTFKVNVAANASGAYTLTILNPDCTLCRMENAITITSPIPRHIGEVEDTPKKSRGKKGEG